MDFDFVKDYLTREKQRQQESFVKYASKTTPKGWDPDFTHEQRKPYADQAKSRIVAIEKTLEMLETY